MPQYSTSCVRAFDHQCWPKNLNNTKSKDYTENTTPLKSKKKAVSLLICRKNNPKRRALPVQLKDLKHTIHLSKQTMSCLKFPEIKKVLTKRGGGVCEVMNAMYYRKSSQCVSDHHTVHFKCYLSIKLEQWRQRILQSLFLYSFTESYSGKFLKVPSHTFISQAQKLRKLWREERERNSHLPCGHISFLYPVWNKNFQFQMHSCETMFTNTHWKGSKPKYEHCTKR